MEIFKLFGSIFVNTEAADKSMKKTEENAESLISKLGKGIETAAKWGGALVTAAATAGAAFGKVAVNAADEMQEALNGFAASTGVANDELAEYEDVMKSIYKSNFGESFEDIADSMAAIKQQAGKLTGEELEEMTTNALMLRDTFDMEVNESMRAAKMLMDQFGISGTDAYSLIAQGAQKGLDKNGDLLDSINEYSVHYEQLGFTAEEFFASLENGAAAGTFSVDKLGDAMKEFGIRVKDGSDTSAQAFEYLGYDAEALFECFSKGGEDAAAMTRILIDELTGMPDSVDKTTAGVALFGTMWEDLGVKGIEALGNVNGSIATTQDALEQINGIKYDSLGSAIEGIKRTFETSILIPLGEKLIPMLEEHLPEILAKIEEYAPIVMEAISKALEKAWEIGSAVVEVVKNISDWCIEHKGTIETIAIVVGSFATAWGLVNGAVTLWQTVGTIATAVTTGFGTAVAFLTSPITLVTAAIGALIAIGVLLYKNWDEITEKANELGSKLSTSFEEMKAAISEKITAMKEKVVETFENIKSTVSEKITETREKVSETFSNIKTAVSEKITETKENTEKAFEDMRLAISQKTTAAKEKAAEIFESIQSFVSEKVAATREKTAEAFENIRLAISEKTTAAKEKAAEAFESIRSTVSDKLHAAKNKVFEIFDSISMGISSKIAAARDAVKNAIEKIKGFFDFNWSLPKLKLPHFSISGSFSLNPPSVPSFGIEWYKKGGVLEEPTAFGINGNKLMVGGEAEPEAVAPISVLQDYVAEAVASQNTALLTVLQKILDAILSMDENMGGNMREALDGVALEMDRREFARLVEKAVT